MNTKEIAGLIVSTDKLNSKSKGGPQVGTKEIVINYCENGFNIVETAKKMSYARSTIKYRLERFKLLFDVDPRKDYKEMIQIYNELKEKYEN